MTSIEFNEKWKIYLKTGFYGMDIENEKIIKFLDEEFLKEIKSNPFFKYSQIKMKFGKIRIYADCSKINEWENVIDRIDNVIQ
jgi:hypothetical protein